MNEFDQFVKHELKVKHYARYTDDFVIVSENPDYLKQLLTAIDLFLKEKLKLELHPKKIEIIKYNRGVDFLGYVILPKHIKVRTKTKHRIVRKLNFLIKQHERGEISKERVEASLQSYLGVLSHANAYKLAEKLKNHFGLWVNE